MLVLQNPDAQMSAWCPDPPEGVCLWIAEYNDRLDMWQVVICYQLWPPLIQMHRKEQLNGSVKEPNISIYFFFPPITQLCSISDVLFTGGRGVSDFSVLKYY